MKKAILVLSMNKLFICMGKIHNNMETKKNVKTTYWKSMDYTNKRE